MDDIIVIRADKGLSVMTDESFHNYIYELYTRMLKTSNKVEKEYYIDLIEDLMIKYADYYKFIMSEGISLVGPVEEEQPVEDNSNITNIIDIKEAYAKKEALVRTATK